MENSRCQSLGFVLRAAAYEALVPSVPRGVGTVEFGFVGFGVVTRVPSGVWASTLEPSDEQEMSDMDHGTLRKIYLHQRKP